MKINVHMDSGGGWHASLADVPGNAQYGRTEAEAIGNLMIKLAERGSGQVVIIKGAKW